MIATRDDYKRNRQHLNFYIKNKALKRVALFEVLVVFLVRSPVFVYLILQFLQYIADKFLVLL